MRKSVPDYFHQRNFALKKGYTLLLVLVLAIPTWGLSLVVYFGLSWIRGQTNQKMIRHDLRVKNAEAAVANGSTQIPSWMDDKMETEIFGEVLEYNAKRQGVPKSFLIGFIGNQTKLMELMHLAGAMEAEGASFTEQQVAVSDKLVSQWNAMPPKLQAMARA